MADQAPNEMELRRLAVRAKLGVDQDARSKEIEERKEKGKARDLQPEDLRGAEVVEAREQGREIVIEGPEPTDDPLVLKRRIDGRLKAQPLSEEFKRALVDAYNDNLGVNLDELAKATGFTSGAISAALWEHPKTLAAARSKRAEAAHDALEQAVYLMALELRRAVQAGEVRVTGKNIRDWMVGFGILVDKLALMSGAPTARAELIVETMDERKARLTSTLDRVDAALGLMTTGRTDPGSRSGAA